MMRNENCWSFRLHKLGIPSGMVPRPTLGGGDAGNKHIEVAT